MQQIKKCSQRRKETTSQSRRLKATEIEQQCKSKISKLKDELFDKEMELVDKVTSIGNKTI